jgi:diacylglycerol O-acyltransferase / wax synthase
VPLYACGRQMLEVFPFVPIAGHLRIGVAIFSYNGMLNFGVTGDYDTAPDIGVLGGGVEDGMTELLKLAGDDRTGEAGASAESPAANEV